jgi:DHA2 family multidrug resistance protein
MLGIWGAATMLGPILGPLLGGIITDLASWRWAFAINLPLGIMVLAGLWRRLPQSDHLETVPIDVLGLVLLVGAIAALQLALERSVGQNWLHNPEILAEAAIAVCATAWMALHSRRSGLSILRLNVLRDLNFAAAAFYNFMTSALLFTAVVFIPALTEGPLGYDATVAGATIVPRAVLMMLMMLWVGRLVGRLDCRLLLSVGWLLMAAGSLMLANIRAADALAWIVAGSTVQAVGAGMLFTPLSTLAFSTLGSELRTDAAGLYSLLRQLGYACGLALMTAVLRARIDAESLRSGVAAAAALSPRAGAMGLAAYRYCFAMMGVAALAVVPGVFVFRGEGLRRPVASEEPAD